MNDEQYINALEGKIRENKIHQQKLELAHATTIFQNQDQENMIKWQLDIREELERIERLLRKHIPRYTAKGELYFEEPSEKEQLFNEHGVNEILNLLAWYLNKNIILSNFSEEDIKIRMAQFGNALVNLVFNNYEEFGLIDKDKIKYYPMVVLNIINTVEASYYRALNGGERESLRTARTVTQSVDTNGQTAIPSMQNKKSVFKPWTWG